LEKFRQIFIRQTTTVNILILFGLVLLFMGALFPFLVGKLHALSGNGVLLDTQFYYPPEKAVQMIASYGIEGRQFYLWMLLTADLIFPLIYGALLAMLLIKVGRHLPDRFGWLGRFAWLPCLPVLADYGENAAIGAMLRLYPNNPKILAGLASLFTSTKWSSLLAVSLLIAGSWLLAVLQTSNR